MNVRPLIMVGQYLRHAVDLTRYACRARGSGAFLATVSQHALPQWRARYHVVSNWQAKIAVSSQRLPIAASSKARAASCRIYENRSARA